MYQRAGRLAKVARLQFTDQERVRNEAVYTVHEIAVLLMAGIERGQHVDDVHITARRLIKSRELALPRILSSAKELSDIDFADVGEEVSVSVGLYLRLTLITIVLPIALLAFFSNAP